jgi:BirA family biotin operon repressor/biotin-[acetyl-CoA-carboxylase] ligase
MDTISIYDALACVPLSELHFLETTPSTNDHAFHLIKDGVDDWCLIVTEEQTAGRGRGNRNWLSPARSALTFSIIIRPSIEESRFASLLPALAAISVHDALSAIKGVQPSIKWPNDLLVNHKKVAGILVESDWQGGNLKHAVIGIGINILRSAISPSNQFSFPATTLEDETDRSIPRWGLLAEIVQAMHQRRKQLIGGRFLPDYRNQLSYIGRIVRLSNFNITEMTGTLTGVSEDGSLILTLPDGKREIIQVGELHLRLYNGD